MTSFSLGAPRTWTTTEGERHEETEWFNVVAWADLAEACKEQLVKGSRVFIGGRLQTHSWEDGSGQKHHRSEIVTTKMLALSGPPSPGSPSEASPESMGNDLPDEVKTGLNSIVIIGNLGRDPELHYTPSGKPVTSFILATSRTWSTSEGEKREETEWFNVITWGNLAEICQRYLRRGSRVYIEGRLQTHEREDSDGSKHYRTEVVADEMIRLDSRTGANNRKEDFGSGVGEEQF
jgi:single-strand DNA-binding protein